MIEVWHEGSPIPFDSYAKKFPMIPIEEIKSRNPIERVIGGMVPLNKKGMGRCPFHEEKTPSFVVYHDTQRYKCFGCGASGDVVDFIQSTHRVSISEAIKILDGNKFDVRVIPVPMKKPKPVDAKIKAGYEKIFKAPQPYYAKRVPDGIKMERWKELGAAWSEKKDAWMIPFRNAACEIIGFQFRSLKAFKWAMDGSSLGLFIPRIKVQEEVFIAEGATDCAALLSLGVYAIARPAAFACHDMLAGFIKAQKIKRAIIVSDYDPKVSKNEVKSAGIDSALKLKLKLPCESRIIVPPNGCKDIREAVIAGLDRKTFLEYAAFN
jgi:hypothetical protein